MKPMPPDSSGRMPVALVMISTCLSCAALERTSVEKRLLSSSPWRESRASPDSSLRFPLTLVRKCCGWCVSEFHPAHGGRPSRKRCVWLSYDRCQRGNRVGGAYDLSPRWLLVCGLWPRKKLWHEALQHLRPC